MPVVHSCSQCQAKVPADAPAGLCPRCLVQMGFHGGANADQIAQTAYQPRFISPTVEELAASFPQLEILAKIGHGGMGVVYKAKQRDLDRIVALKILRPDVIARDAAFADRFLREARALARLSHPAVVAVYDFGRRDNLYYLLMEHVDGTNLRELEQSAALSPDELLRIVPQICDALQYAHDQGVVHRDIKPENILIDSQGRAKIADFGLAKMMGIVPEERSLTGTWQVMGTVHYMAPEQMQGAHGVDHRADIYSLGVVIYEMLTGELPVGRFLLPSQKVQIDARLDEVVLRAMERQPERRYQHASEVKTEVETITDRGGVPLSKPLRAVAAARGKGAVWQFAAIVRDGWEGLSSRFPTITSVALAVVYVAAAATFFRSHGDGGPRFTRVQYEIGAPLPWYNFEFKAGKQHGFKEDYEHRFRWQIHFLSPAWIAPAVAFGALWLDNRGRLCRGETVGYWSQLRTHAIIWLVVAAIGMLLGPAAMATHLASQG